MAEKKKSLNANNLLFCARLYLNENLAPSPAAASASSSPHDGARGCLGSSSCRKPPFSPRRQAFQSETLLPREVSVRTHAGPTAPSLQARLAPAAGSCLTHLRTSSSSTRPRPACTHILTGSTPAPTGPTSSCGRMPFAFSWKPWTQTRGAPGHSLSGAGTTGVPTKKTTTGATGT